MSDIQTTTATRFQCRHIFTDGRRCQSPALRKENFCYYHHTSRPPVPKRELAARQQKQSTLQLPMPEDRSAIQQAIGQVLQLLAANDLDPRRAGLLLYGLQIASQNLPKPQPEAKPQLPVEEVLEDPELGPLAPVTEYTLDQAPKGPAGLLLEKLIKREASNTSGFVPNIQAVAATRSRKSSRQSPPPHRLSSKDEICSPRPLPRSSSRNRPASGPRHRAKSFLASPRAHTRQTALHRRRRPLLHPRQG